MICRVMSATLIPNYILLEKLYEGKQSLVYRGYHAHSKQKIVIKLLKSEYPTSQQIASFKHEYEITKRLYLNLPEFIIQPIDFVKSQNSYAIILEDFEALSLDRFIKGNVQLNTLLKVSCSIVEILGQIHAHNVLHKDINPSNILINPKTMQVKFIDFGISTPLSFEWFENQSVNSLEGTLSYISPEQTGRMNRVLDYRSDYYSLGVTLYEMFSGRLPFESHDALELVYAHLAKIPISPDKIKSSIPHPLSNLILKLLSKTPEERYQSSYGILADLRECERQYDKTKVIRPFTLASKDVPTRFQISEKLYGREEEIGTLMKSFEAVTRGKTTLTLISGAAGIGKSALVHEIHKPIALFRGYYSSGKCDQYKRNLPYESLVQALQKLVLQILSEPSKRIAKWKEIFQKAVGINGNIVIDMIPQLKLILGSQPIPEDVEPIEAKIRFRKVFQNFIQALTYDNHPVTIFFDDIQWIDYATLDLLQHLLTDPNSSHLFLIGAYRDNLIDDNHPLTAVLEQLKKQKAHFNMIQLHSLKLEHIEKMLQETLHCSAEKIKELAELCYSKTQGNPFFLNQLLISLYQERLIVIDLNQGAWQWDIAKIKKTNISDNVVEFMSKKILELRPEAQRFLKIAACVGNTFDLKMIAKIAEETLFETTRLLWEAIEEGLVIPENENYKFVADNINVKVPYRFLHDRVQQAVYTLIDNDDRATLHYKIAKAYLKGNSEQEIEDNLFEITNQFNEGESCIQCDEDKIELALMNIKAGVKARKASAFENAIAYYENAKRLLGDRGWAEFYETYLDLFKDYSTSLSFIGEHEKASQLAEEAANNAKTSFEKAEIISMLGTFLTNAGSIKASLSASLEGLRLLGMELKPHPSILRIIKEFSLAKWYLSKKNTADLLNLPDMTDPKGKLLIKLIDNCDIPATFTGLTKMTAVMALKKVNLTLSKGKTEGAGYIFIIFALTHYVMGDLKKGQEYCELALKLNQQIANKFYKGRTLAFFGHLLGGWQMHWKYLMSYLNEAKELGQQTGDILAYTLSSIFSLIWDPDMPQEQVVREGRKVLKVLKPIRSPQAFQLGKILFQMRASLCGQTKTFFDLDDEEFNEKECIEGFKRDNFNTALGCIYQTRAILHYHFDDFKTSYEYLNKITKTILESSSGGNFFAEYTFYSFYIHASVYPSLKGFEKFKSWRFLKKQYQSIKKWARHCPVNFSHHQLLMEAELARLSGNVGEASIRYIQAIQEARKNEYIRYEALANERAALFYISLGLASIAKFFLHDARYCYNRWGATAKIKLLEETYPELIPALNPFIASKERTSTVVTTTEKTTSEVLDFISVMKASQAMTREIHLENLIVMMMQIVIQNAGAEKGFLLLEKEGQYLIEAVAQGDTVEIKPSLKPKDLPKSILQSAILSKEPVVVDEALKDERFNRDSAILNTKSKSILCYPLLNLGDVKGLLYLENKLTYGVFTQERLDVIGLISTQMAISIDNARFYGELEQKVQERTLELKEAQDLLIQKEKMAFLGLLTTGIGHEMKNPLNFIINFSKLSVDLIKEIYELLTTQRDRTIEQLPEALESLSLLKEQVEATFKQGKKADTIVNRMIEHSAITGQQFVQTDLHHLINQSIDIFNKKIDEEHFNLFIEKDFDRTIPQLKISDIDLQRVFINLLDNAYYTLKQKRQARGESFKPQVIITTKNCGMHYEVHFKDNGEGIAPEYEEKIFTPFFTTKPTGQGVGLGLSLCHNIVVNEHGGTLTFQTQFGEYTDFVITFKA